MGRRAVFYSAGLQCYKLTEHSGHSSVTGVSAVDLGTERYPVSIIVFCLESSDSGQSQETECHQSSLGVNCLAE